MPRRSDEHLEARRRQILDGARRAFARHGYEGATVARLEQETGLSRGAIFNYFPSKWELFYALAQEDATRAAELWVEQGFDGVLRHLAGQRPEWVGVYLELVRHLRTSPEARERWERRVPDLERQVLAGLEAAQAAGEIRDDLSADEISSFLSVVLDGVALHVGTGWDEPVEPLLALVRAAIEPRPRADGT